MEDSIYANTAPEGYDVTHDHKLIETARKRQT